MTYLEALKEIEVCATILRHEDGNLSTNTFQELRDRMDKAYKVIRTCS